MKLLNRIHHTITSLYPKKFKKHIKKLLIYAGEKSEVKDFLGPITFLAILFSLIILIIPLAFSLNFLPYFPPIMVLVSVGTVILFYLLLYFKAEDRTKRVEEVLPDVLQLIAANVRAGMTPFQALRLAARKEFGPLHEEIKHATAQSLGTESFSKALLRIGDRVNSEMLNRTLSLFTTAMRSGGHLATLLEELAKDLEETKSLKKEMLSSTKTYISFIMFSIIIGAPLLLAISVQFLDFITNLQTDTSSVTTAAGLSFLSGEIVISPVFMTIVSIVMLLLTSLLASSLLGVIKEGKAKYGLKYAPIIIMLCLAVFFVLRRFISNFFVNLM
jgi:pilus assembly protein TadC